MTLTANVVVAAIQEASLRGQIEATNKLIDINSKALEILRKQFDEGYANRNDVAAQEAALAQIRSTCRRCASTGDKPQSAGGALRPLPQPGAERNL